MDLIQTIHGLWRWVLAITAIILIAKSVIGLARGAEYSEADRKLAFYFAMAVTVQFLLGAANLIGYKKFLVAHKKGLASAAASADGEFKKRLARRLCTLATEWSTK